jgi:hypothetical protein
METAYNVKFVDVTAFQEVDGIALQGYQLKAFSILLSSFEEVVGGMLLFTLTQLLNCA